MDIEVQGRGRRGFRQVARAGNGEEVTQLAQPGQGQIPGSCREGAPRAATLAAASVGAARLLCGRCGEAVLLPGEPLPELISLPTSAGLHTERG